MVIVPVLLSSDGGSVGIKTAIGGHTDNGIIWSFVVFGFGITHRGSCFFSAFCLSIAKKKLASILHRMGCI
jgi:hypothetical protein